MAKGIAIILVVYGHCLRGLASAGVVPSTSWLVWTDYLVYTFHMPIFFLLSGLFFRSSVQKGQRVFWITRLKSIVYPYFLWSIIQGCIQLMLAGTGAVNGSMEFDRLIGILWAPISPFWFLYALFFCGVLAFLLVRVRTEALFIGAFLAFLASFFLPPGVIRDIAYGFLYFTLGVLARERDWLRQIPSSWGAVGLLSGVFLAASLVCRVIGVPERLPFAPALLGIAATLALCTALERAGWAKPVNDLLSTIGQCSMSVYVMHILVLGFIRTVMMHVFDVKSPLALMPVAIVAAVVIPVAIQMIAVRMRLNEFVGLSASASVALARYRSSV